MAPPSDTLHEQLAELIAIPSVSADAEHAGDIVAAAEWVASHIRSSGGSAELVPWGARPLVVGEVAASKGPESAPTVLCYAHFDVQPPDPLDLWESGPFVLTHRDGRLYARGVADDKGNLFVLVEAVRQLAEEGGSRSSSAPHSTARRRWEATRSSRGSTRMPGRPTSR